MYITTAQSSYDRERDAKIFTKTDLMAFLELLFLSGVKRDGDVSFLELWATDGSGIEIFRVCMSYNRFLFLLVIRFETNAYKRPLIRDENPLYPHSLYQGLL